MLRSDWEDVLLLQVLLDVHQDGFYLHPSFVPDWGQSFNRFRKSISLPVFPKITPKSSFQSRSTPFRIRANNIFSISCICFPCVGRKTEISRSWEKKTISKFTWYMLIYQSVMRGFLSGFSWNTCLLLKAQHITHMPASRPVNLICLPSYTTTHLESHFGIFLEVGYYR